MPDTNGKGPTAHSKIRMILRWIGDVCDSQFRDNFQAHEEVDGDNEFFANVFAIVNQAAHQVDSEISDKRFVIDALFDDIEKSINKHSSGGNSKHLSLSKFESKRIRDKVVLAKSLVIINQMPDFDKEEGEEI